ncbi:MAG: T9SS type A sorting domain-containing protein [Saprospiraceae bacterium]|nr:T9SS type A sorting domain-containing protein [Saprospiraceae bacterium]
MNVDFTLNRKNYFYSDLLHTVAANPDPYAAYGRALLYKLMGEKIEPLLPEIAQRSRNNDNGVVKEIYTITPNPSSDFIKISIENAFENDSYDYEILDMTGNKVNAGSLSTQSSIDVSKVPSGIYFVQIMKNHIPDTIQKIVILK